MVYRLVVGVPLTVGEVEANFKECLDLVTVSPTVAVGFITNFDILKVYLFDGTIALNVQTGAISGAGTLWAIENGKNMSSPVEVI